MPADTESSIGYPSLPPVIDPTQVRPQDSRDRKLVEFLYDTQKGAVSREQSLSDKALSGLGNLETWFTDHGSGDAPKMFRKFLEQYTARQEYQPAVLLYPRLIRVIGKGIVEMQIMMAAEFERGFLTMDQMISALRENNHPLILEFFAGRAGTRNRITADNEEHPGNMITGGDPSMVPNLRMLSAEQALIAQVEAIPARYGMHLPAFEVFRRDVLYITAREHSILQPMAANFYMMLDGKMIPHEEVVYAYRVLADAFEQHVRHLCSKQKQLKQLLAQYDERQPVNPDRRQEKNRILGLVEVFEKIVERNPQVEELRSLAPTIELMRILGTEMDRKYDKQAEQEVRTRTKELADLIHKRGVEQHTVVEVDPRGVFSEDVFNNPEWTRRHAATVLQTLKSMPELCYVESDPQDPDSSLYLAPKAYLFRIEAERKHRQDEAGAELVDRLVENLASIRPDVISYRGLLKQVDEQAYKEAVTLLDALNRQQTADRQVENADRGLRDRAVALGTGFAGSVVAVAGYAAATEFHIGGAVALALVGFGMFYFAGQMFAARLSSGPAQAPTAVRASGEKPPSPAAKKLLAQLFPPTGDGSDVMAAVYADRRLEERLRAQEEVVREQDEARRRSIVSAMRALILPHLVAIRIPAHLVPVGYADSVLVRRRDLQRLEFRRQLSAHYRKEAARVREHQSFNEKAVDYYEFLAGEVEFNSGRLLKAG